jgi:hypothetical protein
MHTIPQPTRLILACLLATALFAASSAADTSQVDTSGADTSQASVPVRTEGSMAGAPVAPICTCDPWTAFALGIVLPGGGQFYLGDWIGGIEAVASDIIIFEALRRSGATAGSLAFFIGAMHLVEAGFAVQECQTRRDDGAVEGYVPRSSFDQQRSERWRVSIGYAVGVGY